MITAYNEAIYNEAFALRTRLTERFEPSHHVNLKKYKHFYETVRTNYCKGLSETLRRYEYVYFIFTFLSR